MRCAIILTIVLLFNSDTKAQWLQIATVSTTRLTAVKFINENTGFASAYNGIWKTTNGGTNWFQTLSGSINNLCFIDTLNGFACGTFARIYKTTNCGLNWSEYVLTNGFQGTRAIGFFNMNTGVSTGDNGIINRTTNSGNNWNKQDSAYFNSLVGLSVLNNGYGWTAGVSLGRILKKTTNFGINWISIQTSTTGPLDAVFAVNSNLVFVCGHFGTIERTTNSGLNWVKLDSLTSRPLMAIIFLDANTGYIAGEFGTILKTTNSGDNWFIQSTPTTTDLYGISFINAQTGWAVGLSGIVLKTTNGGLVSFTQISSEIPKEFLLYQNYPNPFNPTTFIRFDLVLSSFVRLTVYNILGNEVQKLVNEEMKPGKYEVEFNTTNFTSGIYFYKLSTNGFSKTKKMILIR